MFGKRIDIFILVFLQRKDLDTKWQCAVRLVTWLASSRYFRGKAQGWDPWDGEDLGGMLRLEFAQVKSLESFMLENDDFS